MADENGDEIYIPEGTSPEEEEQLVEAAASKKFAADLDRMFREAGLQP